MERTIVNLESVDQFNKYYGYETRHPLVSIVDLSKSIETADHVQINYGVYVMFLKETKACTITYGRQKYDYDDGTMVSFAPGQTVTFDAVPGVPRIKSLGLVFHPDLIRGTNLGKTIHDYTFFSYFSNEALQLSQDEHDIILDCFNKIAKEIEHGVDKHSRTLITMNIELLLNYCMRLL
jgi:hypothetical protein